MKFQQTQKLNRQDLLFCLASLPESSTIVAGSSDATLHAFDLDSEKPEGVAFEGDGHTSYVTGLAQVGGQLVSGSYDKQLVWWDVKTRKAIRSQKAHDKWIRGVVASPDGKTIASVADDMVCRLWDAQSGALKAELLGHEALTPSYYPSMLFACAFHPDGHLLATADKVGRIVIWSLDGLKPVKELEAPIMYTWDPDRRRHSIGGIRSLAFSPDGSTLVAGGMGQVGNIDHLQGKARIRAFDWERGETLAEIETDQVKGLVERIIYTQDGSWLTACGGDHKGFLLVVDPKTWKLEVEEQTAFHVHDYALGEADKQLCAVGHNGVSISQREA